MTILEIIKDETTNLPITRKAGQSFKEILSQRLFAFNKLIQDSKNLIETESGIFFTESKFQEKMNRFIKSILKTVDDYYKGRPSDAYNTLSQAFQEIELSNYLVKDSRLEAGNNFYRVRLNPGSYALPKNELFHIPFELRGRVATQRYSIQGLPSLYVSNSLYVAWEELGRPDMNMIQAVRLENTRDLYLLDLTTDVYNKIDLLPRSERDPWKLLYKIIVWPLVAACSIKVGDPKDNFKPEYIIPQLLLQWVNKNLVDGIVYSSTHIDLNGNGNEGSFWNCVFPVKTFEESGYCRELVEYFSCTEVISMQMTQFVGPHPLLQADAFVNKWISEIELIKGKPQNYFLTAFGQLEKVLLRLQADRIC